MLRITWVEAFPRSSRFDGWLNLDKDDWLFWDDIVFLIQK